MELPTSEKKKVVILVDWDNLLMCLYQKFSPNVHLEDRIEKFFEWIHENIGETLCGVVFTPRQLSLEHQKMWIKHGFKIMFCPKVHLLKAQKDSKSGAMRTLKDTVDNELMDFGEMMLNHQDIGCVCLVSGDKDYVPFLEKVAAKKIKRAIAPPTLASLSTDQRMVNSADVNPRTGTKLIFRFDTALA